MHKESLEFINSIGFSKIHVFPYSERRGTASSRMDGKINGQVIKRRARDLIEVSKELPLPPLLV